MVLGLTIIDRERIDVCDKNIEKVQNTSSIEAYYDNMNHLLLVYTKDYKVGVSELTEDLDQVISYLVFRPLDALIINALNNELFEKVLIDGFFKDLIVPYLVGKCTKVVAILSSNFKLEEHIRLRESLLKKLGLTVLVSSKVEDLKIWINSLMMRND